jgi:hypothetical protein
VLPAFLPRPKVILSFVLAIHPFIHSVLCHKITPRQHCRTQSLTISHPVHHHCLLNTMNRNNNQTHTSSLTTLPNSNVYDRLTSDNLKRLDPSTARPTRTRCPSHAIWGDNVDDETSYEDDFSLFSDAASVSSACTSAPDEDDIPYTVTGDFGEPVTVYSSLAQAVQYSQARARAPPQQQHLALPTMTTHTEAVSGGQDLDEDEDAYFSMG